MTTRILIVAMLLVALVPAAIVDVKVEATQADRVFRAGAAISNITPPLGVPIVGNFTEPPATHVHDELHARCLILDDGRTRLAIVVCDNVGIVREVLDEAKRFIQQETGLAPQNVLISATHTHSGPSARYAAVTVDSGPLSEYQRFLARRIADGVRYAINNLEPARVGWGVGREPTQVFNRRWKMKPGTHMPNPFGGTDEVVMNPGVGNPNLLEPAGPTDPDVSFISVQSKMGRPIALLANYSLHYVGGVPGGHISADYFAAFAQRIAQMVGAEKQDPPFVGMMSNGTSGDVNNINFRGPALRRQPYEKMRQVANMVAAEVLKVLQTIEHRDDVTLGAASEELQLAYRKPTPQMVEYAKQVLAKPADAKPYHPREAIYSRRALDMVKLPTHTSVFLQTLRIGDVGIAAIPFEVFAEIGLELKQKSPFKPTFTISIANGAGGYLPTPEQHKVGGYETWLGTNRVEVEASTKITAALLRLLERVK